MFRAYAGSGSVTKMLVRVLILIVAITSTKGFPSPNSDQDGEIDLLAVATHVQLGCAAALLCVEEQFCTTDGTISLEPISLTSTDLLHRVPLSTCKNPENGVLGKCCRDPNYVDPWPTENLPKNYSGGFNEQGFPTFLNIVKVRPPRPDLQLHNLVPVPGKLESVLIPDNSVISAEVLIPPIKTFPKHEDYLNVEKLNLKCGVRNMRSETQKSETVFAEIPWQAMVLHSKERKILCSGVLISNRDVLTAANCIDSMVPDDILIKLGEWKLGYELKHEEPLPYEILNVTTIKVHPGYTNGLSDHDLAVLHLENPAILNRHVNPLCLFKTKQPQKNKSCIITGWGKSILQAHYAGAIMHAVDLDILSTEQCTEQLIRRNLNRANEIICGTTKKDINNICEADIGGPLACENKYGLYELVGIYSQDTGCLSTNQVAFFAPLDDDWLKEMIVDSTPEQNLSILPEENKTNKEYEELPFKNDYRKSSLSTNNEYLPAN
ncbi:inactive serine protease scarface isoform X3 [Ptiloglossa arizonensis]|uniref:inactive serine protease scarface isoform X3 n=1 Tax=Ptiloglossa arizonensis TaxID=3350558 RepID=UPI003FA13618